MEARAIARYVRQSPRKMRLVIDEIRGRPVGEAFALLEHSKKRASGQVGKTLRSAVANAEQKAQEEGERMDIDALKIKTAFVDEGPKMKRWRAAAMGRAAPIRRPTSHVTIVVDSGE